MDGEGAGQQGGLGRVAGRGERLPHPDELVGDRFQPCLPQDLVVHIGEQAQFAREFAVHIEQVCQVDPDS
jgi:hypothetical protein